MDDPGSRVRDKQPKSHNSTRTLPLDSVTLKGLTELKAGVGSPDNREGQVRRPAKPGVASESLLAPMLKGGFSADESGGV